MQITERERSFIRLVQKTRFGRIENIRLSGGFPIVDDNTDVYAEYKLSGVDMAQEVMTEESYMAKPQVRAMLDRFHQVRDGIVECLDVRDGLPFKMTVKRSALI